MKKFFCSKRCRFGGREYYPGDEIPAELVDPARVKTLQRYGTISVVDADDPLPVETVAANEEPEQVQTSEQATEVPAEEEADKKGSRKKGRA